METMVKMFEIGNCTSVGQNVVRMALKNNSIIVFHMTLSLKKQDKKNQRTAQHLQGLDLWLL